jgi:hypothetical protein
VGSILPTVTPSAGLPRPALASSPQCWGPGSIYRALVPLWRDYFHPPAEVAGWDYGQRRSSKRIGAPPLKDDHDRRRANLRLVG